MDVWGDSSFSLNNAAVNTALGACVDVCLLSSWVAIYDWSHYNTEVVDSKNKKFTM